MEKLYFKGMNPTSDLVVLKKDENGELEVLMIQREGEVEHMKWALPGGFINTAAKKNEPFMWGLETPKQAALREALEELKLQGINIKDLMDIGIYDQMNRDPRNEDDRWVGSYVYGVLLKNNQPLSMGKGEEIVGYEWKKCRELKNEDVAFDHEMIISEAVSILSQEEALRWKNKKQKM